MALKPALTACLASAPRIGDWLSVATASDGQRAWVVHTGKVEIGQGIHTALRQIAASALGCDAAQVHVASPCTARSPDEGTTSGSRSVEDGGALVFGAGRTLARVLRERSADATLLSLVTPDDLALPVDANLVTARFEGSLIGCDAGRAEIHRKLFGVASFVHDMRLDGMLHARMLRGPWHRGVATNLEQLRSNLPAGVQWFADGNFVALLSDDEDRLVKALQRCQERAEWGTTALQGMDPNDPEWLMHAPCETSTLTEQPAVAPAEGQRHTARYTRPYLSHASIGPSCALASFEADVLQIWTHSQGIFNLRAEIAGALHLPLEAVVVHHAEGSGCYGHNGADDAAFDAALLAFRLHKPVRVQWMREDEFSSAPFGPATAVQVCAVLTPAGRVADWQFDSWGGWSSCATRQPDEAATARRLANVRGR